LKIEDGDAKDMASIGFKILEQARGYSKNKGEHK
jgi:hypothetical protein